MAALPPLEGDESTEPFSSDTQIVFLEWTGSGGVCSRIWCPSLSKYVGTLACIKCCIQSSIYALGSIVILDSILLAPGN
jgi:hypothetical protein